MPVGAIIGGAASVGGSLLASKSANKNARRAAETSERNNAANNALARESRDLSFQRLDPFTNRGQAAGEQINSLLGIGGGAGPNYSGYVQTNPDLKAEFERVGGQFGNDVNAYGQFHWNNYGKNEGRSLPDATQTIGAAQRDAFDTFRNSTGYQFRLGEGLDAVGSAYAGIGGLQSGAALRGIEEYGQNFASNEFGNYLNALGAQQATGAGAASAGAGVSQNYASQVIGSNNLNTSNQLNAQLSRQNPFANALGAIGGAAAGYFSGGR